MSLDHRRPRWAIVGRRASAAYTCLEELGYGVTAVGDTTADYSDKEMHPALEVKIPRYATTIVTTNDIIHLMSAVHASELGGH
jgi:ureidoacrylate peracid hydrolase